MNKIIIVEFPSNLGLKEPDKGHEPGVKKLPHWLRKHNFHDLIKHESVVRVDPPEYSMNLDKTTGVRNADNIVLYANQQVAVLQEVLAENNFPVVIGGDCSILIGNALALKKRGNFALFFLDGHTDFMLPSLSETGGAAGMDLAIVTGYGHDKLTNISSLKPFFEEQHVWCVGNRYYEELYVKAIMESNIHYTDLKKLRQDGIKNCIAGFLKTVETQKLDGFWVHIDVDVLNDNIMPAVDSRQPDGLHYEEFNEMLQLLLSHEKVTGLEITILDPELDPTAEYTAEFVGNFCEMFGSSYKGSY